MPDVTKCALFIVITAKSSSEHAGFTLIRIAKPNHLDGDLGIALAERWWGKGYGTEITEWLKPYSFKTLGPDINLSTFIPETYRALRSTRRRRYSHTLALAVKVMEDIFQRFWDQGTQTQSHEALWKEGAWVDMIWMGIVAGCSGLLWCSGT